MYWASLKFYFFWLDVSIQFNELQRLFANLLLFSVLDFNLVKGMNYELSTMKFFPYQFSRRSFRGNCFPSTLKQPTFTFHLIQLGRKILAQRLIFCPKKKRHRARKRLKISQLSFIIIFTQQKRKRTLMVICWKQEEIISARFWEILPVWFPHTECGSTLGETRWYSLPKWKPLIEIAAGTSRIILNRSLSVLFSLIGYSQAAFLMLFKLFLSWDYEEKQTKKVYLKALPEKQQKKMFFFLPPHQMTFRNEVVNPTRARTQK